MPAPLPLFRERVPLPGLAFDLADLLDLPADTAEEAKA